mmetsp:Transcript_7473/g.15656  ORF Transcript_7473/g.15656 Transcript_7473/m.15656 type:complete len:272 (-) Transcript_7473:264-1079(-)
MPSEFLVDTVDLSLEIGLCTVVHSPLSDAHLDLNVAVERLLGHVRCHVLIAVRRCTTTAEATLRAVHAAVDAVRALELCQVDDWAEALVLHHHALVLRQYELVGIFVGHEVAVRAAQAPAHWAILERDDARRSLLSNGGLLLRLEGRASCLELCFEFPVLLNREQHCFRYRSCRRRRTVLNRPRLLDGANGHENVPRSLGPLPHSLLDALEGEVPQLCHRVAVGPAARRVDVDVKEGVQESLAAGPTSFVHRVVNGVPDFVHQTHGAPTRE